MTNANAFVNFSNFNCDSVVGVNLYDGVRTFTDQVEFALTVFDVFPNVLVDFEFMFRAQMIGT